MVELPRGYTVYDIVNDRQIVVAMSHEHMFARCTPEIEYKGRKYAYGPMAIHGYTPNQHYAIYREYNLIGEPDGPTKRQRLISALRNSLSHAEHPLSTDVSFEFEHVNFNIELDDE